MRRRRTKKKKKKKEDGMMGVEMNEGPLGEEEEGEDLMMIFNVEESDGDFN